MTRTSMLEAELKAVVKVLADRGMDNDSINIVVGSIFREQTKQEAEPKSVSHWGMWPHGIRPEN